jgi:hypothetical protein
MGAFDALIPIRGIARKVGDLYKAMTYRPWLSIEGSGVTIEDDPTHVDPISRQVVGKTKVTITGGGGESTPIADQRVLGNVSGSTATASALTPAQVRTLLNVADGAPALASAGTPAAVGTAASRGTGTTAARDDHAHILADGAVSAAAKLADGVVSLAKLANIATARILGRTTAGSGVPEELTGTQVTAMLDVATTSLKGLLSTTFFDLLNGATSAATALALLRRDSNGDGALRYLTAQRLDGATSSVAVGTQSASTSTALGRSGANTTLDGAAITVTAGGYYSAYGLTGHDVSSNAIVRVIAGNYFSINAYGRKVDYNDQGGTENRIKKEWAADVQTTNATTATGWAPTVDARGGRVVGVVRGRHSSGHVSFRYEYDARLTGGAAAWVGGDPPLPVKIADPFLAGCQLELDLSTTTVRRRITGIAATTIDWSDTWEMER